MPDPHTGGDNATYVSLAQALLAGSYHDAWDPAGPAHSQYPPVFPAMLALAWSAGLRTFATLKLVTIGASAAAAGLSAAWTTVRFGRSAGLAAGVFLAMLPGALEQSHWVLSDVPFWTFSALTLLALAQRDRIRDPGTRRDPAGQERHATLWGVIAVAGVLLAYLTRSAGVPLVLAASVHLALRRDWRLLAAAAAVLVPTAVAWAGYSTGAGGGYGVAFLAVDPYQPHLGTVGFGDMVSRFVDNLNRYGGRHLPLFMFGSMTGTAVAGAMIIVGTALAGWASALRRPRAAELFLPLYIGLLLIWPATWSGERFLLPAVPLIIGYALATVLQLAGHWQLPRRRVTATVCALVVIVLAVPLYHRSAMARECRTAAAAGDRLPCTGAPWRDLLLLAEDLRGTLPEGSVVMSRKPQLFFVLSGYESRLYPMSSDPETFFAEAGSVGADWVVVDQSRDLAYLYLHPMLLAARDEFCVIADPSRPDATLLRIERGGPAHGRDAPPNAFRQCDPAPPS